MPRILLSGAILLLMAGCALTIAFYLTFLQDLPELESLADYQPSLTTSVLDREGRLIGSFYEKRRQLTPLESVPDYAISAFIAAEDDAFYEHRGIDFTSIARAAWANLRAGGETVQGASTITQQMVKQLLLSSERTYRRKVREMILARRIEERFSKDEILFLYLNEIYFGSGAYGIGEAARTYYGKPVGELSIAEAAQLAGLPKAPGRNNPHRNPAQAEKRRLYVLQRMLEEGMIDEATHATAVAEPPEVKEPPEQADFEVAAYFTEEVRRHVVEALGSERVLKGGLRIETTLDLDLQRVAHRAVRGGLEALDQRQGYRGPERQVGAEGLAEALPAVAETNGIDPEAEPGSPAAGLKGEGPWQGVVIAVSKPKQQARVAFAPGVEGVVRLAEVTWARRADSDRYGEMESIDAVFAVGDVARFVRIGKSGAGEARFGLFQRPLAQGALLSYEVDSGDLLAMIGGYDFEESEFNRATQARRQPGSAFKPLIYAAALEYGMTPASILYDRPVVYDDPESGFTWRPQNYGRRFLGPLLMSEALARSVNNATIHLLRDIGVGRVVRYARKLGISSPLDPDLSLALGSSPVSPLELTRAYAVFVAGGRLVEPRFIRRVLDREGNVLLENLRLDEAPGAETVPAVASGTEPEEAVEPLPDGQVIPSTEAYLMTDLLKGVVEQPRGTGRRAQSLGHTVAGKTGTTNEQGDAWFVGFSADVVTGAWVGHDERQVLGRGETGGRAALPIWIDFMKAALAGRPKREFTVPERIVFARIDAKSGEIASADSEEVRFQAFLAGTAPTESARASTTPTDRRRRLRLDF